MSCQMSRQHKLTFRFGDVMSSNLALVLNPTQTRHVHQHNVGTWEPAMNHTASAKSIGPAAQYIAGACMHRNALPQWNSGPPPDTLAPSHCCVSRFAIQQSEECTLCSSTSAMAVATRRSQTHLYGRGSRVCTATPTPSMLSMAAGDMPSRCPTMVVLPELVSPAREAPTSQDGSSGAVSQRTASAGVQAQVAGWPPVSRNDRGHNVMWHHQERLCPAANLAKGADTLSQSSQTAPMERCTHAVLRCCSERGAMQHCCQHLTGMNTEDSPATATRRGMTVPSDKSRTIFWYKQ